MAYDEKSQRKFRLIAPFYDLITGLALALCGKRNPRTNLVAAIANQPARILDVCTGTGIMALAIAKEKPACQVTGIDLSKGMLRVARKKQGRAYLNNVSFVTMDATAMEYPDHNFDLVTVSFALHEMAPPQMLKAIAEMARVLKPGGVLIIADFNKGPFSIFLRIFEPKHITGFLELDWQRLLAKNQLKLEKVETFSGSKLIFASRE